MKSLINDDGVHLLLESVCFCDVCVCENKFKHETTSLARYQITKLIKFLLNKHLSV